jgi:hypothetical protein
MTRAAIVCAVSVALLSACNPDPKSTRVIARVSSPDGTREAVYAEEMGGGATVGPTEQVYVVAKGRSPQLQDRVFSQERVCNLQDRWLDHGAIEIGYSARTPEVDTRQSSGPVGVHTKWLGRDAASGC